MFINKYIYVQYTTFNFEVSNRGAKNNYNAEFKRKWTLDLI